MTTVIGALIFVLLGCVAVYGFLTESKAADRLGGPRHATPTTPQTVASGHSHTPEPGPGES